MEPIKINMEAPGKQVDGFFYLWSVYVTGFDAAVHCKKSLRGIDGKKIGRGSAIANKWLEMDEATDFDALYICGGTAKWENNLHIVAIPKVGEEFEVKDYRGRAINVKNAVRMEIPWVEEGRWGLPLSFTTCRNWQFGVAFYDPPAPDLDVVERRNRKSKRAYGGVVSGKNARLGSATVQRKAAALRKSVIHVGDICYQVPSAVAPHIVYDVALGDQRTCNCKWGRERPYTTLCSHVQAAMLWAAEELGEVDELLKDVNEEDGAKEMKQTKLPL